MPSSSAHKEFDIFSFNFIKDDNSMDPVLLYILEAIFSKDQHGPWKNPYMDLDSDFICLCSLWLEITVTLLPNPYKE